MLNMCVTSGGLKSRVTREIKSRVSVFLHTLEHFNTLSHSLPLQQSHLNTGLLNAEIQANLARNKANRMVCKVEFNQPSYWLYSIPNLLVFQHLVTLYLGGIVVRVVNEIEC